MLVFNVFSFQSLYATFERPASSTALIGAFKNREHLLASVTLGSCIHLQIVFIKEMITRK